MTRLSLSLVLILALPNGLERLLEVSPSGIDVFHCDLFTQHSPYCGDVFIQSNGIGVSYLFSAERGLRKKRIYKLNDNSQNIKLIPYECTKEIGISPKRKSQSEQVVEMAESDNSDFVCSPRCPF